MIYNYITSFTRNNSSFLRFLLIGSTNTLIDLTLFAVFANILNINPIGASILSTAITISISFPLNQYFVFRSQRKKRHTLGSFLAITLFNAWIVQSLVIFVAVHALETVNFFAEHDSLLNIAAKVASISVSMFLNYFGYRYIFDQKRDTSNKT